MNQELIINTILQVITPVVTVVLEIGLVLLVAFAVKFIKKYLIKLGIVIDDEQMSAIEDVVKKAVITINQKMVDNMKELSPNGKLTAEQQTEVYNAAYDIIKASLSEDQLGLIEKVYGKGETGIELLIENMVVKAKEEKKELAILSSGDSFVNGVQNITNAENNINESSGSDDVQYYR